MDDLTEEQIENWRRILTSTLGSYALIMPVEDIKKMRGMMQAEADELREEGEDED